MEQCINIWHFTDPKALNRSKYILVDFTNRLYLRLFIVYMTYAAMNSISAILLDYAGISDWKWPEAIIELVLYCLLLYGIYRMVRDIRNSSRKENCGKDVFADKDLVLIINRSLLISAAYLILISIFDTPELFRTSAILYITFFVGFTISLSDIVACENDIKFTECFKKTLLEVGFSFTKWKEIVLITLLLSIAVLITRLNEVILLIVLLAILLFCFLASKLRMVVRHKIYKAVYNASVGKNVLVLECCPDKAITIGTVSFLKSRGAKHIKLDSISKAQKSKYEVVILSNILSRTQDVQKNLKRANKYLAEDGVVIAPACISKKKRKPGILTRLGLEQYFLEPLTKEEYVERISENGWDVYNTLTDELYVTV